MIDNIRWGTFLLWGLFDFCIAFFAWFCLTETRGKSLEEITRLASETGGKGFVQEEEEREEVRAGKSVD